MLSLVRSIAWVKPAGMASCPLYKCKNPLIFCLRYRERHLSSNLLHIVISSYHFRYTSFENSFMFSRKYSAKIAKNFVFLSGWCLIMCLHHLKKNLFLNRSEEHTSELQSRE